ncbi:MAG: hypothetical protein WAO58_02705 [Fimbriimonadaceae bacterium]
MSVRSGALLIASVVLATELAVYLLSKQLFMFWILGGLLGGLVGGLVIAELQSFFKSAFLAWGITSAVVAVFFMVQGNFGEAIGWFIGPFVVLSLPFMLVFGGIGCLIRGPSP